MIGQYDGLQVLRHYSLTHTHTHTHTHTRSCTQGPQEHPPRSLLHLWQVQVPISAAPTPAPTANLTHFLPATCRQCLANQIAESN